MHFGPVREWLRDRVWSASVVLSAVVDYGCSVILRKK
jgi:hypothetical protein